jgi:hypothetical protein
MSPAAARRLRRHERHVCLACRVQRSLYSYGGYVRADRHHNLCFRCFRSEVERQRARRLRGIGSRPPVRMGLAQRVKHACAPDQIACA